MQATKSPTVKYNPHLKDTHIPTSAPHWKAASTDDDRIALKNAMYQWGYITLKDAAAEIANHTGSAYIRPLHALVAKHALNAMCEAGVTLRIGQTWRLWSHNSAIDTKVPPQAPGAIIEKALYYAGRPVHVIDISDATDKLGEPRSYATIRVTLAKMIDAGTALSVPRQQGVYMHIAHRDAFAFMLDRPETLSELLFRIAAPITDEPHSEPQPETQPEAA